MRARLAEVMLILLLAQLAVGPQGIADQFARDPDLPIVNGLQMVDTAQQGGLAAAAGAQKTDDFARIHAQRDALQDLQIAEALADILYFDQRHQPCSPASVPSAGSLPDLRWPRPKRRSIAFWIMVRSAVSSRYQMLTTNSTSKYLKFWL